MKKTSRNSLRHIPDSFWKFFVPVLFLLAIFLAGVFFRLWFTSQNPQAFIFDQEEYEFYALKMRYYPFSLASHSYRSYLYPLFLTLAYKLSFFGDHNLIYYLQAFMDSFVSVFIFFILHRGFRVGNWAWFGAVVYAFNPFTSGYVGVILSESMTIFFVGLMLLSGVLYFRSGKIFWAVLFGFATGCIGQARNQIVIFTVVPLFMGLLMTRRIMLLKFLTAFIFGFLFTALYPLYVNWRDYRVVAPTTIDNMAIREMYNGIAVGKLRVFRDEFPIGSMWMWAEFYSENNPGRTNEERARIDQKYIGLITETIKNDPVGYLQMRFEKMWFVWQKEAFFLFNNPRYQNMNAVIYIGNLILLICSAFGYALTKITRENIAGIWLKRTIIGTIIISTLAFSLSTAEQRYTIILYPMVFIGVSLFFSKINSVIWDKK